MGELFDRVNERAPAIREEIVRANEAREVAQALHARMLQEKRERTSLSRARVSEFVDIMRTHSIGQSTIYESIRPTVSGQPLYRQKSVWTIPGVTYTIPDGEDDECTHCDVAISTEKNVFAVAGRIVPVTAKLHVYESFKDADDRVEVGLKDLTYGDVFADDTHLEKLIKYMVEVGVA